MGQKLGQEPYDTFFDIKISSLPTPFVSITMMVMTFEIVPSARLSYVTAMAFLESEGSLIMNSVFRSFQESRIIRLQYS